MTDFRRRTAPRLLLVIALVVVRGAASDATTETSAAHDRELRAAQAEVFAAALARITPGMVRIETIGGALPITGDRAAEDGDAGPAAAVYRQSDGPTTGVIWSSDGWIVSSSFNFMREPTVITVALADGRRLVARLVARDAVARLALLKVDAEDLPTPMRADPGQVQPGSWALTAGFGFGGRTPSLSVGAVSAVRRARGLAIQADAKISPANYGGPLFDIEGRLLGVCVPQAGEGESEIAGVEWYDSGIGFAVSVDEIARRVATLKTGRDIVPGFLGVNFNPDEPVVGEERAPGLRIDGVLPGPAADAGLAEAMRVLEINGAPVVRLIDAQCILARASAGDEVQLQVEEDGVQRSFRVTLVTRAALQARIAAAAEAAAASQPASQPVPDPDDVAPPAEPPPLD